MRSRASCWALRGRTPPPRNASAAILGFFGLFILFVDSVSYGAGLLVIAFLISPYGLPMLATWLLAKLHVLRYAIQDRIYG